MPKPYILHPISPFKLDTSKPIEPQIEIHVEGRADYIIYSRHKKNKNLFCGCPIGTSLMWRNRYGRFVKPLNEDAVTVTCRYCKHSITLEKINQCDILNQLIVNTGYV